MSHLDIREILNQSFQNNAKKTAIDYNKTVITYEELEKKVDDYAKEFRENFPTRSKVLLVMKDPIEFIAVWISLLRFDCVIVPFQGKENVEEIERAMTASNCDVLIDDRNIEEISCTAVVKSTVNTSIVYRIMEQQPITERYRESSVFFYTSGTTGLPKCVAFSRQAITENVMCLVDELCLTNQDVFFTPLSPTLTATITTAVLPALAVGADLVLTNSSLPGGILKKIQDKKVSIFFAVPYVYDLLNGSMKDDRVSVWNSVRICLTSSAFMKTDTFDTFLEKTGLPMRSIYCSSEGGAITFNKSNDSNVTKSSVGASFSGVEIKILDENKKELECGTVGEIYVGGSHLAIGYYNMPELEETVFLDGCVKTGDLGYLDENGYLFLKGRSSDTINVSGYLVNPEEVEQILIRYEKIKDAVVFGKEEEGIGQVVAAKIILQDGETEWNEDDLYAYCNQYLETYKIPRQVQVVSEITSGRYGKKIRK